ncbi:hypothetical protein [Altericroceibacterium xinjiangense]|uniref:hypothetical protein n=1 Tax=Altericroceibacterium xinjiangense TaxID=762261 RepID=UPI000F7DFEB8|nr:hypothetical protein [Altericroceibacterium xinjiangense]
MMVGFLFVDLSPRVQSSDRPSAQNMKAAREIWSQLKVAQSTGTATEIYFTDESVGALSALLSDASGIGRIEARLTSGVLSSSVSIPLPLGFWMNAEATATGQHDGFPVYRLRVGRVTFPQFASRWFADAAWWALGLAGARLPSLDELVRQVRIDDQQVTARIALPRSTGVFDSIMAVSSESVDQQLVRKIYCQAATEQREDRVDALPLMVNRIFAKSPSHGADSYSRAAFIALSLLVVGEEAEALVPDAAALAQNCPRRNRPVYLHGREDLAKHWTLSAALTSVLGEKAAANIGEWKELDDSLAGGSGFSFVDLAADRAGLQTALRSFDVKTASQTTRELSTARDNDLLPSSLLEAPEGLSNASFADRFGSLEERKYRQAIAHIDGILGGEMDIRQR